MARGALCGGNLSLLAASLGTPWEIDTRGKVLFLEDIGEKTNGKKTVGNTILIMTGGHNAKICPTMQQPGMALPDSQ